MQLQKDNVKIFAMEETKTQNSIGIYWDWVTVTVPFVVLLLGLSI